MEILSQGYMSLIWDMGHVWQGWITTHTTAWPPIRPQTYSAIVLDIGTKKLNHASGIVVQWWWRRYGYAIPLFFMCYIRHGPRLLVVVHPIDHGMTSNYTRDILGYYPGHWNQELLEPWISAVGIYWYKDDDTWIDMTSHHLMSVILGMNHVW